MDTNKALIIEKEIRGNNFNGVIIEKYLNNGKSAAVFLGYKDEKPYAVKIFDNELLQNFGVEIQKQRIDLELSLKNHTIDNLIKIIDGGEVKINDIAYFYLVMNYVNGKNLKQFIASEPVTNEFVEKVLKALIKVSEELLRHSPSLVHRDIKPENIMVSNKNDIILMDLGVLKIIGNPSVTDVGKNHFLGTLRYAAPEFLRRKEEDSVDGWRAVNIYQIGTVLHDLIMKRELFDEEEPYSNLVIAIKEDMPSIINNDIHPDLIQLVRNMLSKDWKKRLEMCSINNIEDMLSRVDKGITSDIDIFENIKNSTVKIREDLESIDSINRSNQEKDKIRYATNNSIFTQIHECIENSQASNSDVIRDILSSNTIHIENNIKEFVSFYKLYQIYGKFEYGFNKPLYLLIEVSNNENMHTKISILGALIYKPISYDVKHPDRFYKELILGIDPKIKKGIPQESTKQIDLNCIFDGIVDIKDQNVQKRINIALKNIVEIAVEKMKPELELEVENRKKRALYGSPSITISTSNQKENYFINKF